ncbi:MAG: hypothetical protein HYZ93_05975 [Candidatus Omnitrophica bacterium]|nr:hypothetical protein [Candidatus Omnitrophota bacterium]
MEVLKGILKDSLAYYRRLEKDLIRRMEALPKGSVKRRRIKSRSYYYLQFRQGSKVVHKYLGVQEPKALMEKIRLRRTLVRELKKTREALHLLPQRKIRS